MAETLVGLSSLLKLFDTLPQAAEQEIKEDLPRIADVVLSVQRDAVAVRTGDLYRGLSVQVLDGGLRLNVGLVGFTNARSGKTSYGGLYYGRFVEFGRSGQIVRVERRRRVGGQLRFTRNRKRAADVVATYNMRVRAAPPRPFVHGPAVQAAADRAAQGLVDFWDKVLARAGGAS